MQRIPQSAPHLRISRYRKSVDAAIARVIGSKQYILGAAVNAFEQAFADYLGVRHCVGVGNGTEALTLGLRALGIGAGEEVITVALTFAGTAQAIALCGAIPRFVDVDASTRCMDPDQVEAAITTRTAAIMPVHLFGQPADMSRLCDIAERHKLAIIEDCAQAHGATIGERKLGSYGHVSAFSFYPTKNLGCIGDGGAVVTNDLRIAERVSSLRNYGWKGSDKISCHIAGNSRLDEMQAAILSVLLVELENCNSERRAIAAEYRRLLADSGFGLPPDDPSAVYHQFAVTCPARDSLQQYLATREGVDTAVHYWPPLHRHPAFSEFGQLRLPVTEALSDNLLSLPIQPEVAAGATERITEALKRGLAQCLGS
jgi:dTDP-3-amino-3,4,6-trideoxy-alpha-D-glucose transaminase